MNGVEPKQDVVVLDEMESANAKSKNRTQGKARRPTTFSSSMSTAMGYSSSLVLGASAMARDSRQHESCHDDRQGGVQSEEGDWGR